MSSGSITESLSTHNYKSLISAKCDKSIKNHKKKSKKRKRSDPLVASISNLLSTSLSLISPEANAVKEQTTLPSHFQGSDSLVQHEKIDNENRCDNSIQEVEVIGLDDYEAVVIDESLEKTHVIASGSEALGGSDMKAQSKNAFEFMMESRNKSIGRNSPGKEIEKETIIVPIENKDKLIARKLLFEKWATAKGCKKRKVEEKEREIYVKQQLQKRAKKLKKMLSIDERQSHKKVQPLISDSEDSQDVFMIPTLNTDKEMVKVIDTTANSCDIIVDLEQNKDGVKKNKSSLDNFLSVSKPEKRKFREDTFESNENENENLNRDNVIKVKMFSPTVFKRTKKANKKCIDYSNSNVEELKSNKNYETIASSILKSNNEIRNENCKIYKEDKHSKMGELGNQSSKGSGSSTSNRKVKKLKRNESVNLIEMKEKVSDNGYLIINNLEDKQNKLVEENTKTKSSDKKILNGSRISKKTKVIKEKKISECKSGCDSSLVQQKLTKLGKKNNSTKSFHADEESSNDSVCFIENVSEKNKNASLRRSLRKRTAATYKDSVDIYLLTSDETEDDECKKNDNKGDKIKKIAPVFLQNKIKPKVDPLILEARRKFLMSGIPDALKKSQEKQQSLDNIKTHFFPEVSHIQQKHQTENGVDYWNLPQVNLPLSDLRIPLPEIEALGKGLLNKFQENEASSNFKYKKCGKTVFCSPEKINNLKLILLEIKKNNPDYPVFKSFRLLKEKFDRIKPKENAEKRISSTRKKRNRKNKKELKSKINKEETESDLFMMWSEKYKANTCEDLIGNYSITSELKKWLQVWLDLSENRYRIAKCRDSSGSEFDVDSDSQNSTCPKNAVILTGPHGSGKTMTVYAVCNKLGINVLELNASSKRTGKRLMQEMQEATQSHQVRKTDTLDLDAFFNKTNNKRSETTKETKESSNKTSKMCLLLVEDVDIVFEQDEGFLSALMQLLTTSKRPIILTATDISTPHLQRVIGQNSVIQFSPLKPKILTVWMQILCLLEGCFINNESLSELLEWNKGDVRKTLLQLQFWVESGGGNTTNIPLNDITRLNHSSEEVLLNDDTHLSIEDVQENNSVTVPLHSNCVSAFLDWNAISLDNIWWNLPRYFNLNSDINCPTDNINTEQGGNGTKMTDLQKFCNYFECVSKIDRSHLNCGIVENNHLTFKNKLLEVKDSSELSEVYDYFNPKIDFVGEWSSTLLSSQININRKSENIGLDMGLPNSEKRRWENKQRVCKENYKEMVPLSYYVDRRAFALDYFPCLRTITRSEMERSANTEKRRNRFFNYFRTLGFSYSDTVLKTACNVLDHNCKDYTKR